MEAWIVEYYDIDGTFMTFNCEAYSREDAQAQCIAARFVDELVGSYRR